MENESYQQTKPNLLGVINILFCKKIELFEGLDSLFHILDMLIMIINKYYYIYIYNKK